MARLPWISLCGLLVLSACGSGSDGESARGGEGAACTDGYACQKGLVCFVQAADAIEGACTKPPAACSSKVGCDCLGELEAACGTSASCEGILGNYVLACAQGATLLTEGAACSPMRDCEKGLYCHVPTPGHAGACKQLPSACAADPSCACFESQGLKKACSSGWHCSIIGDRASVACM